MKKRLLVLTGSGALVGFMILGSGWAQAPRTQDGPIKVNFLELKQPTDASLPESSRPAQSARQLSTEETLRIGIGQIVMQLGNTDDEEKKAYLTMQLQEALTKHFDADMEARTSDLGKLELRLNKLRAQLDRRGKAKSEIIQLQVKVLVSEAEGLGFSGASDVLPRGPSFVEPLPNSLFAPRTQR